MSQRLALILSGMLTFVTLLGIAVGRDVLLPTPVALADVAVAAADGASADAAGEPLIIEVVLAPPTATPAATARVSTSRPVVDIGAGAGGAAPATATIGSWSPFGAATATAVPARSSVRVTAGTLGQKPTATPADH